MRLQSFSIKHFLECIKSTTLDLASRSDLIGRMQNTLLRLEYYELTSATLLDQQENLLSLVGADVFLYPLLLLTKIPDVQH
jgi:hypothetical protein